jgi:cellulose synthase/poly-beta-1,6-N-acetylglucosamine synthase-like glycosyltransferase
MEMGILILKAYLLFVMGVMFLYTLRHFLFTLNRSFGDQRISCHDIIDSDIPSISVLIPMHNEERTVSYILNRLTSVDYPPGRVEVIPINDHSTDKTGEILDHYASRCPQIKPLHRSSGERGKPVGLNDALRIAQGEIIIIFDADYLPPRGILRDMAVCFKDPEVGALMGRVIPDNSFKNLLTRLLDLERSGGYQVDQQARFNLMLIPQYGGTVAGFRKEPVMALGGFNPAILAEDTELTFKLFINGWKVAYANRIECYEEAPERWDVRARQIRRWARGHTQVMFKYLSPLLKTPHLSLTEKIDGLFLLFVYATSPILLPGICDSLVLFFLGEMQILSSALVFLFLTSLNTFGNFAPFYEIGMASVIDGATKRLRLLPFLLFNFFINMWYISFGFVEAIIDLLTRRKSVWDKTERFRSKGQSI